MADSGRTVFGGRAGRAYVPATNDTYNEPVEGDMVLPADGSWVRVVWQSPGEYLADGMVFDSERVVVESDGLFVDGYVGVSNADHNYGVRFGRYAPEPSPRGFFSGSGLPGEAATFRLTGADATQYKTVAITAGDYFLEFRATEAVETTVSGIEFEVIRLLVLE